MVQLLALRHAEADAFPGAAVELVGPMRAVQVCHDGRVSFTLLRVLCRVGQNRELKGQLVKQ